MMANDNDSTLKAKFSLEKADIYDENLFEDVWLPLGDEKEQDIQNLIRQNRITR